MDSNVMTALLSPDEEPPAGWQDKAIDYLCQPQCEEFPLEWLTGEDYPRLFGNRRLAEYTTREVGLEGEHLATLNLILKGYEIIDRNWRCKYGEADLVVQQDSVVVLVEVKTRTDRFDESFMLPEDAVDARKRRRYQRIALAYLAEHPRLYAVRFDVIAIQLVSNMGAYLRHIRNAFTWED